MWQHLAVGVSTGFRSGSRHAVALAPRLEAQCRVVQFTVVVFCAGIFEDIDAFITGASVAIVAAIAVVLLAAASAPHW